GRGAAAPRLPRQPGFRGAVLPRPARGGARDRGGLLPAAPPRRTRQARDALPGASARGGTRPARPHAGAPPPQRRGTRGLRGARPGRGGGGRLRAHPAAGHAGGAPARLPQHPRLLAAALARRRADPCGHPGGRHGNRRHDHAHGRRIGHRPDPALPHRPDRTACDHAPVARRARRPRRRDGAGGARRRPAAPPAAGRRRHGRAQAQQGGRQAGLARGRRVARPQGASLRALARHFLRARRDRDPRAGSRAGRGRGGGAGHGAGRVALDRLRRRRPAPPSPATPGARSDGGGGVPARLRAAARHGAGV
ncbi:MAG: Methionyl-tRNA formyltransferase, partial [uncultured Acetobacteraceae bacterium]